MKNPRAERVEGEEEEEEDRISQLPEPILHHILSFLFGREALQTCLLSKSWRCLVFTRPKIEFCEKWFTGGNNKETFLSVLDKTVQRYHDQKLSIQNFSVEMSEVDSESTSLLEKWIKIVASNMGLKRFSLWILSNSSAYFDLPSVFFKAKSLQYLYLRKCKLSQIHNSIVDNLLFEHLETLALWRVYIADETFEKIMSCCPSIEDVRLDSCEGLKTVKLIDKHRKLKEFEFHDDEVYEEDKDYCSIKIDVLTIERINIWGCPNWFHHHCHKHFLHLKDLYLMNVRLSTKSFDSFTCNFPSLEDLSLCSCYGFKEIQLSSRSIKCLAITGLEKSVKITIDAPNLIYFEYSRCPLPSSISFTTSGHEWKSDIRPKIRYSDYLTWFIKLNEVLKALSKSQISLDLSYICGHYHINDINKGGFNERVAVEHLVLRGHLSRSSFSSFLTLLFRICRPRYISAQLNWTIKEEDKELTKFLCEILLHEKKEGFLLFATRFGGSNNGSL